MKIIERQLTLYKTIERKEPFREWLKKLRDVRGKQVIQARLARVRLGNFGEYKQLGDGVVELKINFGPGYRIYLAQEDNTLVILLCAGDKKTQNADIKKAKTYWADYQAKKIYEKF